MTTYTLTFQVQTDCDPSTLLDLLEDTCEGFTGDGYGMAIEPVDGSACVEEIGDAE